jgi:hypothetical protein
MEIFDDSERNKQYVKDVFFGINRKQMNDEEESEESEQIDTKPRSQR